MEPGFDKELSPYYLVYHLEGIDRGPEFEGFLIDPTNPLGSRYKGQIGRVKASFWPFKDGVNPKNPSQVFSRDNSILTSLAILAKTLGKTEALNKINADTIEEYVPLASDLLSGDKFLSWCIGGKEYDNKQGYTNYDLFLPRADQGKYIFEELSASPSKLQQFDETKHIIKKKAAGTVSNFDSNGTANNTADLGNNQSAYLQQGSNNDFDLPGMEDDLPF